MAGLKALLGGARQMSVLGGLPALGAGTANAAAILIATPLNGAFTFIAPISATYLFSGIGGGGSSGQNVASYNGGAGGVGLVRKYLSAGQSVSVVSGARGALGSQGGGSAGTATTFGFPDGSSMSCGGGGAGTNGPSVGSGGTVTGADVGSPGGTSPTLNGPAAVPGSIPALALLAAFNVLLSAGCGAGGAPTTSVGGVGGVLIGIGL